MKTDLHKAVQALADKADKLVEDRERFEIANEIASDYLTNLRYFSAKLQELANDSKGLV